MDVEKDEIPGISLGSGIEDQIAYLRKLAAHSKLGMKMDRGLIFYKQRGKPFWELATISPQHYTASNRETHHAHRRWIVLGFYHNDFDESTLAIEVIKRSLKIMRSTGEPCGFLPFGSILSHCRGEPLDNPWSIEERQMLGGLHWSREQYPKFDLQLLSNLQLLSSGNDARIATTGQDSSGWRLGAVKSPFTGLDFKLTCSSRSLALYAPADDWVDVSLTPPIDFVIAQLQATLLPNTIRPVDLLDPNRQYSRGALRPAFKSLEMLYQASRHYSQVSLATVDLKIASEPVHSATWAWAGSAQGEQLSRVEGFACIAWFDSGIRLTPTDCESVMGMSSRDVLYVSETLLDFPLRNSSGIRSLIGNIGKPGVALLQSPHGPEINDTLEDEWHLVNHVNFDGKCEDNFADTSLHLHLTGAEMPLNNAISGGRFTEVAYVEAVVRIYSRKEWFADIDVLSLYARSDDKYTWITKRLLPGQSKCRHNDESKAWRNEMRVTAIDNWPEIMEMPRSTAVVRCSKNWSARLGLACVLQAKSAEVVIVDDQICWQCIKEAATKLRTNVQDIVVLH